MGRIEDGHFIVQHLIVYYLMTHPEMGPSATMATAQR